MRLTLRPCLDQSRRSSANCTSSIPSDNLTVYYGSCSNLAQYIIYIHDLYILEIELYILHSDEILLNYQRILGLYSVERGYMKWTNDKHPYLLFVVNPCDSLPQLLSIFFLSSKQWLQRSKTLTSEKSAGRSRACFASSDVLKIPLHHSNGSIKERTLWWTNIAIENGHL